MPAGYKMVEELKDLFYKRKQLNRNLLQKVPKIREIFQHEGTLAPENSLNFEQKKKKVSRRADLLTKIMCRVSMDFSAKVSSFEEFGMLDPEEPDVQQSINRATDHYDKL